MPRRFQFSLRIAGPAVVLSVHAGYCFSLTLSRNSFCQRLEIRERLWLGGCGPFAGIRMHLGAVSEDFLK